jgi:hypothetical protein
MWNRVRGHCQPAKFFRYHFLNLNVVLSTLHNLMYLLYNFHFNLDTIARRLEGTPDYEGTQKERKKGRERSCLCILSALIS